MTKPIYEVIPAPYEGASEQIKRTDEDGKVWFIPTDPANSDYQRYLRWLENPDAEEFAPIFPTITTEPLTEQTQEGAE